MRHPSPLEPTAPLAMTAAGLRLAHAGASRLVAAHLEPGMAGPRHLMRGVGGFLCVMPDRPDPVIQLAGQP